MPELPEVETVRRDLSALYVGQTLQRLAVTGPRTVRRHSAEVLVGLEGRSLGQIKRHGKYLLFEWDDGQVLGVHLRMSGQLLASAGGTTPAPHTHAVFVFSGAGELHFVDPRTFGELFIASSSLTELSHLGPDALLAGPTHLGAALSGRRAPLKAVLVDQRVLAGIGNIYADEICFAAGLRPFRPGGSLRRGQVARLATSVGVVLEAAIAARGSTLGDQQYRDVRGQVGRYQLEHRVYGRAGLGCLTCGHPIERVTLGAKSAYQCRKCQR